MSTTATVRAFFDRHVEEWDTHRYQDETYLSRARVALGFLRRLGPGKRVLDMGCGAGHQSLAALRAGDRVVSADFSFEMARATRDRIAREGGGARPAVVVADAQHPPFRAGSFDAVMALGVVGFVPDRPRMVREARALLAPAGSLVCDAGVREDQVLLHALGERLSRWVRQGLLRRPPAPPPPSGWYRENFVKHTPAEFERLLEGGGLRPVARGGAGFGDLRVLGRQVLPWRVHCWLARALSAASVRRGGGWVARHALTYVVHSVRAADAPAPAPAPATREARHAPALRR